jgi:hypothetical protein
MDNVILEPNFTAIEDAQCGYEKYRLVITDQDPESRLRGEASLSSRIAGKDIRAVAPGPAVLTARTDNYHFSDLGGRTLTLVVNGTSHAVNFTAADSTRQAIASRIGRTVPDVAALQWGAPDSTGGITIKTIVVGGAATLHIPESSAATAAELGFENVGFVQTGNDTTRLRIVRYQGASSSSQTVTFTQSDTTLANIARTIQRAIDSVHVAIEQEEIVLSTWAVGKEAGIQVDATSSANRVFNFPALLARGRTTTEEIWLTVGHPAGQRRFRLAQLTFE